VNILAQVCEALDYAHNLCDEAGRPLRIIHRDVSPANILVTNTGIVKLIDFGIAKATISSVKTQTGFIKGKFGYIAPEYITGKIDARVDLFALGVVAHEMLAGRRLFEGKDDFETIANVRELVVKPPSHWNPHVTPDLDDIVMTALERDPAKRWQTASALQIALSNIARDFGLVVGSQQLVEWVEWAFTQVSRASGPMLRFDPNAGETVVGTYDPDMLAGDSISFHADRARHDDGGGDTATPPTGSHRPFMPSDSDETVALDRVRHVFNNLEVLTPPAIAAARMTRLPPPAVAASRETARLPLAGRVTAPLPTVAPRKPRSATPASPPGSPARSTPGSQPGSPPGSTPGSTPPPAPPWMVRPGEPFAAPPATPARTPSPPLSLSATPPPAAPVITPDTSGPIELVNPKPKPPREVAMIVIPPGTTFDKPPPRPVAADRPTPMVKPDNPARDAIPITRSKSEPARPARPSTDSARPLANVGPTRGSVRIARSASAPSYPVAPRKPRTLLWLILAIVALGGGAAATLYHLL